MKNSFVFGPSERFVSQRDMLGAGVRASFGPRATKREGTKVEDQDVATMANAFANLAKNTKDQIDALTSNQKEKNREVFEKQGELQARLQNVEQRAARSPGPGDQGAAYNGGVGALQALLEESPELKAVIDRKARRAVLELPPGYFKAQIISGDGLALPERLPGIFAPAQRRLRIRNLLPSIPATSGSVAYTREVSYDNQARPVSETTLKPESNIVFEAKTAAIVVIAHWIKMSLAVLADTPLLSEYISTRLRYGLAFVEENQLLNGSGVGANIDGMLHLATTHTGGGTTQLDKLRTAIAQLEIADFTATGIVLHPTDASNADLLKSTTNEYILDGPRAVGVPSLWGVPVVHTNSIAAGTFLVADFAEAALVLDRESARVDISTETESDFLENMCRVRAEERIGLAVLRPGGLIKGTF